MEENNKNTVYEIFKKLNRDTRKTYKIWIRKANVFDKGTHIEEQIVKTNDIYHEIGYIYCNTLERIDRIDYQEIKEELYTGSRKEDIKTAEDLYKVLEDIPEELAKLDALMDDLDNEEV